MGVQAAQDDARLVVARCTKAVRLIGQHARPRHAGIDLEMDVGGPADLRRGRREHRQIVRGGKRQGHVLAKSVA